ncbi:MAG: hypothetical protein QMD05_02330 [Candidatus Brocadiaceae bacterium]|nr:hypothetical protein [Candidatus Brocadiaceae bacterium]
MAWFFNPWMRLAGTVLLLIPHLSHFCTVEAYSEVFKAPEYSIKLPENWVSAPQQMGGTAIFYTATDLGPQSCLIVTVEKVSDVEGEDWADSIKSAIKKEFSDAAFLFERKVSQAGVEWREIIYAYSGMKFLYLMTIKNSQSYSFTVTAPEEFFNERLSEFRQIFSTWHFR